MGWVPAGVVLGIGLGGFVDGIVLHQLAQWHNMGSAVLPPTTMEAMRRNMEWDGLFHGALWVITLTGVYMLWARSRHPSARETAVRLTGEMMFGWGAFNLVEGTLNHHLLELHHVRDLPVHVSSYDWMFLLVAGGGFTALGWRMMRATQHMRARDVRSEDVPGSDVDGSS